MADHGPGVLPLWRRLGRPGALGGLIAVALGLWVVAEAAGYAMGSARRMGDGPLR